MTVSIDRQKAQLVLMRAHAFAESDAEVPAEWTARTELVGATPAWRTPVAVLGTVLLARAVDTRINPFALKAKADVRGAYAPRPLCHEVLVPFAWQHGYDLGATGREPLNNQPWFRYDVISPDMRVRYPIVLEQLIQVLEAVDDLDHRGAIAALAAFLRCRRAHRRTAEEALTAGAADVGAMLAASEQFVLVDPEGGKRGQAFVAAVLDLVFDDVTMLRVNDPSRHWPGDVYARHPAGSEPPLLSAEVKQKAIRWEEMIHFVDELAQASIFRGLVAVFAPDQGEIDVEGIARRAAVEMTVTLQVVFTPHDLLRRAIGWSNSSNEAVLAEFPGLFTDRLVEIEARDSSIEEWRRRWA